MAAVTWCRLQSLCTRLKSLSLTQNIRHCSSIYKQDSQQQQDYPDYEVSTEEFKYVERLLPSETVPKPPEHTEFPTPSGWVPPRDEAAELSYYVKRTRNHMLPVYLNTQSTRIVVMIRKVEGDIWAFDADIRNYLEKRTRKKIVTQVHEVGRFVRVKGQLTDMVADFLLEKGF